MTVELLARLGAEEVDTVQEQIRLAHAKLRREQCMAWRHAQRNPSKEGGCDIHREEQ